MKYWMILWLALATTAMAAPRSQGTPGEFDFYVLSLSWSPTFCLTHPDYGFVLHGLWPQYARGGWPATCAPQSRLSREEMDKGAALFPTRSLLTHEWAKHGTCSGLDPLAYLEKTDAALGVVAIPAQLQPFNTPPSLPAREIEALFRESNPRMGNHGLAVICKGKVLSEVRVCLTKDLAFAGCPRSVKTQCRDGEIRIPTQR